MSDKLAIDVAIIPSEEVMLKAISLIEYSPDSVTRLDINSCIPHITLAMGVLNENDIAAAESIIENIASSVESFDIVLNKLKTKPTPDGKNMRSLAAADSALLTQLHFDVMRRLAHLLTHDDVETSMFYSPPTVAPVSTYWVKHYVDKKRPEDFHPHITLGEGSLKVLKKPIRFKSSRLALCHLGSYCTCRKILAETELK